jgi:hypothetical protein
MNDPAYIEAIKANTEAMTRLAVVWEALARKAKAIEANPDHAGLSAAGVPLAPFSKPIHPLVEAYPPKEFSL